MKGIVTRFVAFMILCCGGATTAVAADVAPVAMIVDREVALNFVPELAFFVVQFDTGAAIRVPALIVPPFQNEMSQGAESKWLFGARIEVVPGAHVVTSYGFALGKGRRVVSLPIEQVAVARLPFGGESADSLRQFLMDRKAELANLRLQVGEQESALKRLRQDAEIIGNFARVLDAREEVERIKALIQSVDKDISNLERFIKLANSYPAPKNYHSREQQLSLQIAELADAAKRAEQGEYSRRQRSDQEVQRRLRAMEAARGVDIAELEEQLGILQSERMRLEKGEAPRPTPQEVEQASPDEL